MCLKKSFKMFKVHLSSWTCTGRVLNSTRLDQHRTSVFWTSCIVVERRSQLILRSVVQGALLCCWQCVLFPSGMLDICLCALCAWLCTAWSRSSSEPVASAAGLETVWHPHSHGALRRDVLPRFGHAAVVPMLSATSRRRQNYSSRTAS